MNGSHGRNHKAWIVLVAIVSVSGCTVVQEKGEAYRRAAEDFANPEKLKICYTREGDVTTGVEYRCFGEECELPDCP